MTTNTLATILFFLVLSASGIAYLVYLDSGCNGEGGVMTWHGKVCFEDLTNN